MHLADAREEPGPSANLREYEQAKFAIAVVLRSIALLGRRHKREWEERIEKLLARLAEDRFQPHRVTLRLGHLLTWVNEAQVLERMSVLKRISKSMPSGGKPRSVAHAETSHLQWQRESCNDRQHRNH